MSVNAEDIFADLKGDKDKSGKAGDLGMFSDLAEPGQKPRGPWEPTDLSAKAPVKPLDTGVISRLNVPATSDDAADALKRAFGGLSGAYNFGAGVVGSIGGGALAIPQSLIHAIDPNTPSAEDMIEQGTERFQTHPTGKVGEGEQAASQALSYPFAKGAELGGEFVSRATDPNAPTEDANFQSRFGFLPPQAPKTTPAEDAAREAKTRTGGEFLTNLLMSMGLGEKGAEALKGEKPVEATAEKPAEQPQPAAQPKAAPQPATPPPKAEAPAGSSSALAQDALAQAEKELEADPGNDELKDRVAALREASGPVAKPAEKQAAPFKTPAQDRLDRHMQEAQADGLTPEQAAKYAPKAPTDSVTGLPDQRTLDAEGKNPRIALIEKAQQHVTDTGQKAHYVAFDFENLGGLNKAKTETGANTVLKGATDLAVSELQKVPGATVVPGRHGGDEFNAVVVGGEPAAIRAAVDAIRSKAEAYATKEGLDQVPHTKAGRAPGVGLHAGVEEITPAKSPAEIMTGAERELEAGKGANDVTGTEAQAAGAGQADAGAAPGGVAAPAPVGEEGGQGGQGGEGGAGETEPSLPEKSVREARGYGTGHDLAESEYLPHETETERAGHDLIAKALEVDGDRAEPIIEQWGKDALSDHEALTALERIIHESEQHQEAPDTRVPETRGEEGDHREGVEAAPQREAAPQTRSPDDLQVEKDQGRNSGQESVETGDPTDLFSEARQQTDLADKPAPKEAEAPPAAPEKRASTRKAKKELPEGHTPTGHIVGHTYFSKYWGKAYKITTRVGEGSVRALWQDGHTTDHSTNRGKDPDLTAGEGTPQQQEAGKKIEALPPGDDQRRNYGSFSRDGDRTNRVLSASAAFGKAVDSALADAKRLPGKVDMGPTPDVLLKTGAKDLPLTMNDSTIRKVVTETGKHRISADTLKKLPRALHEPVMVFASNKEPNSRVILTDLKDADGKPIAAVVRFDQREGRHEVNAIATVSDRRPEAIHDWVKAGLLRYMDTKKGRTWTESVGLPSPEELSKSNPSPKLLNEKDIVKPFAASGFLARGDAAGERHTVSSLRTELQHDLGRSKFDRLEQAGLVKLHETPKDIPLAEGDKAADVAGVRGYYDGSTMHLAASSIGKGRGMGVLVHEALHQSGAEDAGTLKELIGAPFDDLDRQFQRLYDSGDKAAVAAHDHAVSNYPEHQVPEERLAKLVEDVTNTEAAARPKKFGDKALDLARRVMTALRTRFYASPFYKAASKLGIKMELAPRDIAALARQSLDRVTRGAREGEHFAKGEDQEHDELPPDSIGQKLKDASDKLGKAMRDGTPSMMRDFFRDVTNIATPLANGTKESAAIAKDYANAVAEARTRLNDTDAWLKKTFTPEQRTRIWEATSAENVARVMKSGPLLKDGFDSLAPDERAAAEKLQKENEIVSKEAVQAGVLKHRFELYDPRFLAKLAQEQGGGSVLNPKGHDIRLTTPHDKTREHVTAEQTEEAARALYGDDAHLIRDVRILPHAIYNLRRIIAARHLMNSLESYGDEHGVPAVVEDHKLDEPGVDKKQYFTIDNPAFRRNGRQLHVHNDFRGPLTAVLRENAPGSVERAVMGLKSKAMGMIVGAFPPVHRSVIFFKTVLAYPGAMLLGRLQAEGEALRLSNSEEKYQATRDGLRDVSQRGWAGSIDDIEREAKIDEPVGKSWTAQMLGAGARVAGSPLGKGKEWQKLVKGTVDDLGHLWHSRLMWEKVSNTQHGIYIYAKRDLIAHGMDEGPAGNVAAQLANRYVGSIPYEDMGRGMRTALNLMFFSRSFTFSNLGVYKDVVAGLPKAIQGQIEREGSTINAKIGNDFARKKAAALLVKDILMLQVMNSALQSSIAYFTNQQSGNEIAHGYGKRLSKYVQAGAHNPLKFMDVNALTPNSENEPGKEEYVYIGRDKQGTGIYLKDPFGKVGQDLLDAMTAPVNLFNRKESTELGPVLSVIKNDKGYGRQVYDPNADGLGGAGENVLQVTKYLAQAQLPTETAEDAYNLATGADRSMLNLGKTLGAPAGLFFSHGAPGGPAAGFVYAEQKEHAYKVQQVMPKAYEMIRQGQYADAIEVMKGADMTPGEMRARIRFGTDPQHTMISKDKEFWARATPEQREAFLEALDRGP